MGSFSVVLLESEPLLFTLSQCSLWYVRCDGNAACNWCFAEHLKEDIVSATLPTGARVPAIAVLVMACDRVTVSRSIDQLLKYEHWALLVVCYSAAKIVSNRIRMLDDTEYLCGDSSYKRPVWGQTKTLRYNASSLCMDYIQFSCNLTFDPTSHHHVSRMCPPVQMYKTIFYYISVAYNSVCLLSPGN